MFHTITIAHRKRIYFIKVGENEEKKEREKEKKHRKELRNAETHKVLKDIDHRSETQRTRKMKEKTNQQHKQNNAHGSTYKRALYQTIHGNG